MVYSNQQFRYVRPNHNIQLQSYEASVLDSLIIDMVKYVDNNNKIFRGLLN